MQISNQEKVVFNQERNYNQMLSLMITGSFYSAVIIYILTIIVDVVTIVAVVTIDVTDMNVTGCFVNRGVSLSY